jgi:O-antigen/teichoic acid export membrane protein
MGPQAVLRRTTTRVAATGIDQCVSSASNFAVGVAVARVAGVAALGEYSIAYATWLVLAATHRALITDPMTIDNDVHRSDAPARIRAGLAAELALGVAASAVFVVIGAVLTISHQRGFGIAFIALAPWVPFLLVQDYWRWVSFMKASPRQALANDIVFDAVQVVAFVSLLLGGLHSVIAAIAAWGVGALAGTIYGLKQHSVRPAVRGGVQWIRQKWGLSKWLTLSSTTSFGATQLQAVLTAAFLGPAALGGLKAAQSLVSGPSLVLLQAGGSLGLPEASKGLERRGWRGLRRVAHFVTAASAASVGLVALVVFLFGQRLLVLFYGHGFGRFAHVADLLAIAYIIPTFAHGAVLSLKATRQTREISKLTFVTSTIAVVSVAILVPVFGVAGAAESIIVYTASSAIGSLYLHFRRSRKEAERLRSEVEKSSGAATNGLTGETAPDGLVVAPAGPDADELPREPLNRRVLEAS